MLYSSWNTTPFILLLIFSIQLHAQTYSYQNYRKDQVTLFKLKRHIQNHNIDSLRTDLANYKNRLGFIYYQCKALIANNDSDPNQFKFLDSAFMQGMTPLCINNYLNKFDTAKVTVSFRKNYLRAYNPRLINIIDSIYHEDQKYRKLMTYWYNQPGTNSKHLSDEQKEQIKQDTLDALWKLQSQTDSTNFIKLKEIISEYGWPGAKKVGDYYCQRPAPDVTIFFIHLGNTRRDYQLSTLRQVIELCEKQEDSWQNASSLMFGLHVKFSTKFSEFSFLEINNNQLNETASFFSVYTMSEIITNSKSNSKIEIRCAKSSLYHDLKNFMLSMNELIPISEKEIQLRKEQGLNGPKKLDENSFTFTASPELSDNVILYKLIKK